MMMLLQPAGGISIKCPSASLSPAPDQLHRSLHATFFLGRANLKNKTKKQHWAAVYIKPNTVYKRRPFSSLKDRKKRDLVAAGFAVFKEICDVRKVLFTRREREENKMRAGFRCRVTEPRREHSREKPFPCVVFMNLTCVSAMLGLRTCSPYPCYGTVL